MMKIVFLLILILISYCSSLSLPSRLKCVDDLCNENVSTARTTDAITSIFGDLKNLKKFVKVNVKGKNVDNDNLLWLVESDGSRGFFNSSMLKESLVELRSDLKIVNNPFYTSSVVDETEDSESKDVKQLPKEISKLAKTITKSDETEDTEITNEELKNTTEQLSDKSINEKEMNSSTNSSSFESNTEKPNKEIVENDSMKAIKPDVTPEEKNNLTEMSNESSKSDSLPKEDVIVDIQSSITVTDKSDKIESIDHFRSPLLTVIFKLEKYLHPMAQSFVTASGLDSWIYLTHFVQRWLCMSLTDFVLVISLIVSLLIIVYAPRILRITRDHRSEFVRQSQLVAELENKLQTVEDVRQQLTIQNRNFEKVISQHQNDVKSVQKEAEVNQLAVIADFERMQRTNENKMDSLTQNLEARIRQCAVLETDVLGKAEIIERLIEERKKREDQFKQEQRKMRELNDLYRERSLEVEDLKEALRKVTKERTESAEHSEMMAQKLIDADKRFNRLQNCFEHFRMFEELGAEERRLKVAECLESRDVRERLCEVEIELEERRQELEERIEERRQFEAANFKLEQQTTECEQRAAEAVRDREIAETKLNVMTEYYQRKEIETQKSLCQETLDRSQGVDHTELWRNEVDNLETERDSLTKTIQKLNGDLKEVRSLANKFKTESHAQETQAFITISNLERELMREKDESKKLRCKLSNYVGPMTQSARTTNHTKERPPSLQSPIGESGTFMPPMFPLSTLSQSTAPLKPPFSGRSSANSLSKQSNNS